MFASIAEFPHNHSLRKHLLKSLASQITADRPILQQIALGLSMISVGFAVTYYIYEDMGLYFPSIPILFVTVTALFVTLPVTIFIACLSSLAADYFFIPPIGGVLDDPKAQIHFITFLALANLSGIVVAALRQMYREAVRAREDAEQAKMSDRSKSTFLATMSHEIRTPLTAILGYTELLLDPKIENAERRKFVSSIRRNSELVSVIINDVIDLSKVEAGKLDVSFSQCSIDEILADFRNGMNQKAKDKGISLKLSIDESVPGFLKTDPVRLRQILLNVVGNAIKFTSHGGVEVNVNMVEGAVGHKSLSFTVKDSGRGIDLDGAERIFRPFTQVHSDNVGGVGLGLALSKRLASLLGGDVVLANTKPGRGSTFVITIDPHPICPEGHPDRKRGPIHLVDAPQPMKDLSILIVDDSRDTLELVGTVLAKEGAKVEVAGNGHEAIELVAQNGGFDVILMDLQMPEMNGYQAIQLLREHGYDGKVVAFSAHVMDEEHERCLLAGFDAYLSKPFTRDAIVEVIQGSLKKTSKAKE